MHDKPSIENRPFDALEVGEELRLVHILTPEDFSWLATQAANLGAGVINPAVAATSAFSVDAAQSGWASALMGALIAGRLPGAARSSSDRQSRTRARLSPATC